MTLADAVPSPVPAPARPRRRAAATAGVVAVAAIAGGGAWAWQAWSAQGPQPAEALPANTLAYLAVDLDPPGGQKVAAYNALRSVPTLKKELGLGAKDDLREAFVDALAEDGGCDLPWKEIREWAGDRAAAAVVPGDELQPVVVLQVSDAERARSGLRDIARDCGEEFGFTVGDEWAVLAEDDEVAKQVAADAQGATLAEDDTFRELTGAAGDAGVLTVFAAPALGKALLDDQAIVDPFELLFLSGFSAVDPVGALVTLASFAPDLEDSGSEASGSMEAEPELTPEQERVLKRMEDYPDLTPAEQAELDADMAEAFGWEDEYAGEEPDDGQAIDEEMEDFFTLPDDVRKGFENFTGLGGVARFDDGGLELEVVADPFLTGYDETYDGSDARDAVAVLPADTAIAFGGGLADGWAQRAITRFGLFAFESDEKKLTDAFTKSTGLTLSDLEDLGGEAVAFAAGPGFAEAAEREDMAELPVAVRVTGDPAKIEAALAKLTGSDDVAEFTKSERTADGVVIGPNPSYLKTLVDPERTLGDEERFQDAIGDNEDATVITYADFSGSWVSTMTEGDISEEDADAFGTAGLVVTEDGDRSHLVLRMTLD